MSDYMDNIEISNKIDSVINDSINKIKVEKRKRNRRNMVIVGCLCLSLLGVGAGFCCTHTAYASKLPIIGVIFAKLENRTVYKGEMEDEAEQLISNEDIIRLENNEKIDNSYVQTSGGLTVSVTEVNYDRTGVYLGMAIQSETAFPKGFDWMEMIADYALSYNEFGVESTCTFKDENGNVLGNAILDNIEGDFTDDKTFVGVTEIDLSFLQYYPTPEEIEAAGIDIDDYCLSEDDYDFEAYLAKVKEEFPNAGEKIELPDRFTCEISINCLYNEEYSSSSDSESKTVNYEGNWNYQLDVAFDPEDYQTAKINQFDPEGYGIEAVHKSKYTITVDTKLPSMGIDYFVVVCDANGDKLENQGSRAESYSVADRDVSKVSVFVCDYILYMDELKGYYNSADYETKKSEKTFAQYLDEYAVYSTTVEWE